jgi:hypothetical protein
MVVCGSNYYYSHCERTIVSEAIAKSEIAQPVPSKARNPVARLRVCFGFASQPPAAPRNDYNVRILLWMI